MRFTISATGLLLSLLLSLNLHAQIISTVFPASGSPDPNRVLEIDITGFGTNFTPGLSRADFGEGITVLESSVRNRELLHSRIRVEQNAVQGPRTVKVITGLESIEKEQGFTVIDMGGSNINTVLELSPVKAIKLTDLDPDHQENAPLFFTISVFNDQKVRDLEVKVTMTAQSYGVIGVGVKQFKAVQPMAAVKFNNRQFSAFDQQLTGGFFITSALQTGYLPADVYSFKVEVFDRNDLSQALSTTYGVNAVLNNIQKPEMIGPGNAFTLFPENVMDRNPLFQWFSQATNFDLVVYPVLDGQKFPEEVALNRPIYKETGIRQNTFIYPPTAAILEEGKTYAWQVVANFNGNSGLEPVPGELYWFTVPKTLKPQVPITDLKVISAEVSLNPRDTMQFRAQGTNTNNELISLNPQWRVIPSDAGTINDKGLFTAGGRPGQVAIVANYGSFQDYTVVTIKGQNAKK